MVLKRCVPLGLCALSVLYFLVLDGVCAESSPAVVSSAEFAKEKAPKALPVLDMTIPDLSKVPAATAKQKEALAKILVGMACNSFIGGEGNALRAKESPEVEFERLINMLGHVDDSTAPQAMQDAINRRLKLAKQLFTPGLTQPQIIELLKKLSDEKDFMESYYAREMGVDMGIQLAAYSSRLKEYHDQLWAATIQGINNDPESKEKINQETFNILKGVTWANAVLKFREDIDSKPLATRAEKQAFVRFCEKDYLNRNLAVIRSPEKMQTQLKQMRSMQEWKNSEFSGLRPEVKQQLKKESDFRDKILATVDAMPEAERSRVMSPGLGFPQKVAPMLNELNAIGDETRELLIKTYGINSQEYDTMLEMVIQKHIPEVAQSVQKKLGIPEGDFNDKDYLLNLSNDQAIKLLSGSRQALLEKWEKTGVPSFVK